MREKSSSAETPFTLRVLASGLPVKDRLLKYEWLRKHRNEYTGSYVAPNEDRLIAQGKTFNKPQ